MQETTLNTTQKNFNKLTRDELFEKEKALDTEITKEIDKQYMTEDFFNTLKMSEFENQMQLFDNESSEYMGNVDNNAQPSSSENPNSQGAANMNIHNDDQSYFDDVYRNHIRDFSNDAG